MKYFGLAAAALVMTISASATTTLVACTGNQTPPNWSVTVPPTSATGSVVCPAFTSLPSNSVFTSLAVLIETDYTGGQLGTSNSITTVYSAGAGATGFSTDTLTSSGVGNSQTYTDSDGFTLYPAGGNSAYYIDPTSLTYPTAAFTINWSSSVTTGSVSALSGQVYELITYTSTAPEPGSLMMLGSGLVAFAFAGRKLVRK